MSATDYDIYPTASPILTLPQETAQHVAEYLPPSDRPALMRTCKHLFRASIPVVWRHVHIKGRTGRNALEGVVCSRWYYARHTLSLTVLASCSCDVYRMFDIFCKAIPRFEIVREVTLTFSRTHSHIFWHLLKSHGLLQSDKERSSADPPSYHFRSFQKLAKLVIHGSPSLLVFGTSSLLTTLTLTVYLEQKEFDQLLSFTAHPTGTNESIQFLSFRLHPSVTANMNDVILPLGATFKSLRSLHIFAPGAEVLDVLGSLSEPSESFLMLEEFRLNDQCLHWPLLEANALMDTFANVVSKSWPLVILIATLRPSLSSVTFADVHWIKTSDSWDVTEKYDPRLEDEWSPYDCQFTYYSPLFFETPPERPAASWWNDKMKYKLHGWDLKCDVKHHPSHHTKEELIHLITTFIGLKFRLSFFHTPSEFPPPDIIVYDDHMNFYYESDDVSERDDSDTDDDDSESSDNMEGEYTGAEVASLIHTN